MSRPINVMISGALAHRLISTAQLQCITPWYAHTAGHKLKAICMQLADNTSCHKPFCLLSHHNQTCSSVLSRPPTTAITLSLSPFSAQVSLLEKNPYTGSRSWQVHSVACTWKETNAQLESDMPKDRAPSLVADSPASTCAHTTTPWLVLAITT